MKANAELSELISSFAELYWLKPVDIVWDAVNAYHIQKWISDSDIILDLGCGDGLYSALMFGGKLKIDYDRFLNVKTKNQEIRDNQFGDIYSNPIPSEGLTKWPRRRINYGLELKKHHIKVADSLGIYDEIIEGRFENINLDDTSIDKVYSIFAFYWGDDLDSQLKEVRRILKNSGEFIVNLPSEHLYDLHISKKLSEDSIFSELLRDYFSELDGGRRKLTTRYGRSKKEWIAVIESFGFSAIKTVPVVNEVMFVLQDICQRPFLPSIFRMANSNEFLNYRNAAKQYLCEKGYIPFITDLLKYEGEEHVRHAYYLFKLKKSDNI